MSSQLPLRVKLSYGVGELAASVPASLSAFFFLYFLTTIVGIPPTLAGMVFLVGRLWDAFNDPIIGWLSDRTQSPLGRRYPWMLYGVVPMSILALLLWVVPPWTGKIHQFVYYVLVTLALSVTITAVQLPFTALAAELTEDYDDRTALMGTKSAFSIGGSIVSLALAQQIFSHVENPKTQYLILGCFSAVLAIFTVVICVLGTYRQYWVVQAQRSSRMPKPQLSALNHVRSLWQNQAFRELLGLYLCAWMGVQVTAAMLPYFIDAWMNLPEQHFAQMALAVMGTAIVAIIGWNWLGKKWGKRKIFLVGAPLAFWALFGLVTVQPGQVVWMYRLGFVAGLGVATLYLVPFAMLPDVIDLDELNTGQRREGIYVSAVVFLQKLGLAVALFLSGQLLGWTGYNPTALQQPPSALWTIRLLIGPLPALLILGSLVFAYRYPITRLEYRRIRAALQARRHHV